MHARFDRTALYSCCSISRCQLSLPGHVGARQVSRGPEYTKNASAPRYIFYARDNKVNQTRVWYLMKSAVVEYSVEGKHFLFDNTPPSTGELSHQWTTLGVWLMSYI